MYVVQEHASTKVHKTAAGTKRISKYSSNLYYYNHTHTTHTHMYMDTWIHIHFTWGQKRSYEINYLIKLGKSAPCGHVHFNS